MIFHHFWLPLAKSTIDPSLEKIIATPMPLTFHLDRYIKGTKLKQFNYRSENFIATQNN